MTWRAMAARPYLRVQCVRHQAGGSLETRLTPSSEHRLAFSVNAHDVPVYLCTLSPLNIAGGSLRTNTRTKDGTYKHDLPSYRCTLI
jgi:hypothetical protein